MINSEKARKGTKSATKISRVKKGKKLDPIASEFISFVAHQMKSPLVAIKGYADLVANGHYGDVSREAHDIIMKIKGAAQRSLDLAENLLDLKKIEEGKMKYDFKRVDLNKIVGEVCDELKPIADNKKLQLIFPVDGKEVMVKADKQTIHQVIQNLVDNAIKYTTSGFVKVELDEKGKEVVVKVSDTGRGMSKGLLKVAFDKFERETNVHQIIQGTGLGLFIAKNIIKAHKGKIWAESEGEGKGSQFYISIKAI